MTTTPIATITDATLREGMQTAAGTFTTEQSVEIAGLLVQAGIDMVECGHPAISEQERQRVARVVDTCGQVPVLTHARLRREDIEHAADTGAPWVGVFIGVNALSKSHRVRWTDLDELLARVDAEVSRACRLGLQVRFTIEDSSRTAVDTLCRVLDAASRAGARRLCVPDTVGCLEPGETGKLFEAIASAFPDNEREGHFHDDRGLAMANALAAVDAGATSISTSVNSLGERAGITDTATFIVNQALRAGTGYPYPGLLAELSRRVGTYSRSHPDKRRPVVGADVFHHASQLHVRAVQNNPKTYELIEPEMLGRQRSTGQLAVSRQLDDLVVTPPVISATELRYHRHGPGDRYVLVDDRLVPGAGQYCIARRFPPGPHPQRGHVDTHAHDCDSLFVFLGDGPSYTGLQVEVTVGEQTKVLNSPASVFVPAGISHSYRAIEGAGTYLNHVLAGSYEASLLDPPSDPRVAATTDAAHEGGTR